MIQAERADIVLRYLADHIKSQGLKASCSGQETPFAGIVEVVGEGPDWTPGTYVRLITQAFEEGLTRCLVGTRGIFGEGWDSLSLNTLIDLTSVTTSTSVQQLRGRTIRKDPTWTRKVAHNWDVVCVANDFKRGDSDLRRQLGSDAGLRGGPDGALYSAELFESHIGQVTAFIPLSASAASAGLTGDRLPQGRLAVAVHAALPLLMTSGVPGQVVVEDGVEVTL